MLSKPQADLKPNTEAFENTPLVKPTGFREYDARWLFPDEINLSGMQALGFGLGNVLFDLLLGDAETAAHCCRHDFRSYSQSIKMALTTGLMSAGVKVLDIGLALSPTAYFAQFHLDAPAVAMVTASHNENGWTGVKMGAARPLTFGPDEMSALRDMVLDNKGVSRDGGAYERVASVAQAYKDDLTGRDNFKRKLKAVVACGNGTAGALRLTCCARWALRWSNCIANWTTAFRITIPIRKIWKCCTPCATRFWKPAPISALPLTAMATAAALSIMRVKKFLPIKWACWLAAIWPNSMTARYLSPM